MKCILHIGTEKTGSTALQRWLAINDEKIVRDGVWYSAALGRQDNRWISVYGRSSTRPDDGFTRAGINEKFSHQSFKAEIERDLGREIDEAVKAQCRFFFISSEHLHSRINQREEVKNVSSLLLKYFDEIEVLGYLRPQPELLQSRISVGIRQFTAGPQELETYKHRSYYDYYDLYKRWAEDFGNLNFRPFKRVGDITVDVCRILGLDHKKFKSLPRVNEKLDYSAGLLSYNMRKYLDRHVLPRELVSIPFGSLKLSHPIKISYELAKEISDIYMESNRLLSEACPEIELQDLCVDLESYSGRGNAEMMFHQWDDFDVAAETILVLGANAAFEKIRALIAESCVFVERKKPQAAGEKISEARELAFRHALACEKRDPDRLKELHGRIKETEGMIRHIEKSPE